ncbi:MAG: hypothetical protein RR704_09645 [Stenotrophomonas sp.]
MSLMGLTSKFKVNRALTTRDVQLRLNQRTRLEARPLAQISAIRMNSSFIELVDKFFAEKGFCSAISFFGFSMFTALMVAMPIAALSHRNRVQSSDDVSLAIWIIFVVAIAGAAAYWGLWLLRQEAFRYTHYPIRLNRQTRMVYVHRIDGTILRIPWDEVFFTLVQEPMFPSGMGANWAIHGHVLDADGETVLETFAFSEVEIPEIVVAHWEFLRRYMEEGPESVVGYIKYYVPVSTCARRESMREGLRHLRMRYGQFAGVALIYFPFDFASACARWVAMRTGKIPVWPEDVEAECTVADDDPWVRDARNNPARYR